MKISRVLKMVCLLALLFAIGSLGTAPPVAAQQRTCYRLVKTITCADDIYKDDPGCVTVRPYDLFTQPDGSIIGKYKIVEPTKGVDSVVEHILVDNPDFSDLAALTKQIEQGTLKFIQDIERFLAKNAT
jgi:hypothetical protein